jgi:tRNA isopentenyl-2-thiomethyl-A-37 hydroxylase MiaE
VESGLLVLHENPVVLAERKVAATECGLSVVRDIYYLKLLAVEVVCQLALDTVAGLPKDSLLFSQLVEQVQEELDHLNKCRIFLSERNAFDNKPGYVRHYARVMRSCARRRRRTLPLAVAVLFCIAVEKTAMKQIAGISTSDQQMSELLEQLGADEEDHYKLVASVVAPDAASRASRLERVRAYVLMLRITAITLLEWWPRRAADYQYLGLRVDIFLEEMLECASRAIRPLGLFFPQRGLLRLARMALRIS